MYEQLKDKIKAIYESGVSLDEAEKLAAEFLHAQLEVSEDLRKADLDARMRKAGLKAIRAAVYLEEVKKSEKKPSDVLLEAIVNSDKIVNDEQTAFDEAEVNRNQLQTYLDVFREAHIYLRGVAKGRFE
jgi:ABC-type metal ion transport system substrate-binding protein